MRRAISCVSGASSFCKAIESGAIFWTRTVGADEQLETSGLSGAVDIGALDVGAGLTSVCAKRTLGLGGFRCRVVGHRAIELDAVGTRRADVGEEFGQEAKLWKTTSALDVAFSIVVAPSLASRQRFLSKPVGFSTSLRNGGKFIKKKRKQKNTVPNLRRSLRSQKSRRPNQRPLRTASAAGASGPSGRGPSGRGPSGRGPSGRGPSERGPGDWPAIAWRTRPANTSRRRRSTFPITCHSVQHSTNELLEGLFFFCGDEGEWRPYL